MKPRLNVRRLADDSAETCATIVMLAPDEMRETILADLLKAFVEVCALHGVAVTTADVDHYANLIKERLRQLGQLPSGATLH